MSIRQVDDSRDFSMNDSVKNQAAESRAAKMLREVFQSGRPLTYVRTAEEQRIGKVLREVESSLIALDSVKGEDPADELARRRAIRAS